MNPGILSASKEKSQLSSSIQDEKKCDDVNLIKTLTLRLEELDNSIKMKDNEIRKYKGAETI